MSRFHRLIESSAGRAVAFVLMLFLLPAGCPGSSSLLAASSGLREYQEVAFVEVPGGRVNVAGGNFHVARVDLSLDTRVGNHEIGAAYNSQSGEWLWSFDSTYDGLLFVDGSGASFDVSSVVAGAALSGTHWVKVDSSQIKTKGGRLHVFSAATGRLDHIRWASSSYPRLVFTQASILGAWHTTEVRQCISAGSCSPLYTVSYDGDGRVSSISDRAGRQATYAYDGTGQLSVARDGLDVDENWPGFRYEYTGTRLSAMTNSENERTEYRYQGRRLIEARQIGGGDPTWSLEYQPKAGGLYGTRSTDPTGVEIRYRYDAERRLYEEERVATGELTLLAWSGNRPTQRVEPGGITTRWSYTDDDITTEYQPGGNVVTFTYAADGVDRDWPSRRPVLRIDDSLGPVEERTYDGAGRLSSTRNGEGETTSYGYDSEEMVATVTRPTGLTFGFSDYGEHGHAQTVTVGSHSQSRVFDLVGNHVSGALEGPEPGGVLSRSYDADRNLAALTLAGADNLAQRETETITFEHRSDGRPTLILRPHGGDHELVYDALGRAAERRERVSGVWQVTTFTYDPVGRVTSRSLPNGMRWEWTFDAEGRVANTTTKRSGVVEATSSYTYLNRRRSSITDSVLGGTESYAYDASGRISEIRFADGELLVLAYDQRSRKTRESYFIGQLLRELDFGYDLADRETSIHDGSDLLLERTYQEGLLAEMRHGNGLTRSYVYDPVSDLLSGTQTRNASSALLEDSSLFRESALTSYTMNVVTSTFGALPATSEESHFIGPQTTDMGVRVVGWTDGASMDLAAYDALSNRVSHDGDTFTYNAERNQLLSADLSGTVQLDYVYDAAGYVTSRASVPITWAASGKVASIGADSFEWDLLGRPTSWIVDGLEVRWLFGGRVQADASGIPFSMGSEEWQIDLATGTHLYRHLDFRGNVKFVTDDQGQVVTHYHYSSYGVEEVFGDDSDGIRFVGRPQIKDLMLLGERVYDPAIGRFLSPDPILQLVNQYTYTLGNPVHFSDPDGTHPGLFVVFLYAVAGGLIGSALVNVLGTGWSIAVAIALLAALGLAFGGSHSLKSVGSVGSAGSLGSLGGPGIGSGDGGGGGGGGGCSPTAVVAVPDFGWALALLLPLQLLLGGLMLRRRRRRM